MFAALTIVAAGSAVAQEAAKPAAKPAAFNERAFPREVRKALQYAHDECRRQGGSRVSFARDTVHKLDLTGDGRDDYIVDLSETECHDRPAGDAAPCPRRRRCDRVLQPGRPPDCDRQLR